MRRRGTAVTLAVLLSGGWAVGQAVTSSVAVPLSRAQKVKVAVTGGPAVRGFTATTSGTTITSVLVLLNGNQLGKTATARFGAGPSVGCTLGTVDLENRTPATCGPFTQSSTVSSTLTVAVV